MRGLADDDLGDVALAREADGLGGGILAAQGDRLTAERLDEAHVLREPFAVGRRHANRRRRLDVAPYEFGMQARRHATRGPDEGRRVEGLAETQTSTRSPVCQVSSMP